MPTNENERLITIYQSRFEELIRAEHTAQQLTTIIADKIENYGTFDRESLKLLYDLAVPGERKKANEAVF